MGGLPLIFVNMHPLMHKLISVAPSTWVLWRAWQQAAGLDRTVYINVLPVQQLAKNCQFTCYWCGTVWCSTVGDFETTVLAWGINGSRTWTDFLNVFLKEEPRLCLDTESTVPTPPLHRNAAGPHSHRGTVITAHLWCAWVCCPDVFTLIFPVQSMWSRKGGSYVLYRFSPFLYRLYSIAKQAEELSRQLMTVNLGEKENWKAIHAWGHRHKLLQVSHTQCVSSLAGSPFMHLLPCHSLWQRFIYPFVPATFWSTNAFKGCPWNDAT